MIPLEVLAEPFARHLSEHLKSSDKQATSASSRLLDSVRAYNRNEIGRDDLLDATVRQGFVNVINAFHVVNRDEIGVRFFVDERNGSAGGFRLTDELRQLRDDYQYQNLPCEVEARWRLVETAWELYLPRAALSVDCDPTTRNLLPDRRHYRRPAITSSRDALNGYQKGKCFTASPASASSLTRATWRTRITSFRTPSSHTGSRSRWWGVEPGADVPGLQPRRQRQVRPAACPKVPGAPQHPQRLFD